MGGGGITNQGVLIFHVVFHIGWNTKYNCNRLIRVRISLPFYTRKLLLHWSRSTTGRAGTTQRFVMVAVDFFSSLPPNLAKKFWTNFKILRLLHRFVVATSDLLRLGVPWRSPGPRGVIVDEEGGEGGDFRLATPESLLACSQCAWRSFIHQSNLCSPATI